jgi:hypothetical protein
MHSTSVQDRLSGAKNRWHRSYRCAPGTWYGYRRWIASFSILLLCLSIFVEIFPDYCPRINEAGMAMEMISGASMEAAMVSNHAAGNPAMNPACTALFASAHAPEGLQLAHILVPPASLIAIIIFLLTPMEVGNVSTLCKPFFRPAEAPPLQNILLLI